MKRQGFTLIELTLTTVLTGIIMGGVISFGVYCCHTALNEGNKAWAGSSWQHCETLLRHDLRQSGAVFLRNELDTALALSIPQGPGQAPRYVSYHLDAGTPARLWRTEFVNGRQQNAQVVFYRVKTMRVSLTTGAAPLVRVEIALAAPNAQATANHYTIETMLRVQPANSQ